MRRHFEADEPVDPVRLVVDGAKDVAGIADVGDGKLVPDRFDRFAGSGCPLNVAVVIAGGDRLGEGWRGSR
jgi:hypothetical protein